MFANPIIRRYSFSQLRGQQVSIFGSLYAGIVLLVLFVNISVYRYGTDGYTTPTSLYKGLFIQFAVVELLLLWLVIPASTSNVVARDIGDKSFDFFRMLPLSAAKKAAGILIGRNLLSLLIAMANLVSCVVFGVLADLSAALIVQLVVVLVAIALALNLLALLSSILTYKRGKATSLPVLIIIGFFAFGPAMGMLGEIADGRNIEKMTASFFAFEMPVLYLTSFLALCVAVWAYIGILRRFTCEYESLFSRPGSRLFATFFIIVLYGLFFTYLYRDKPEGYVAAFWCLGLWPVVTVPPLAIFSYDKYLEITRKSHKATGLLRQLVANSNVVSGLSLFGIWLVGAMFVCITSGSDIATLLWFAAITFSSLMVILALLETYVTWQPKNEKVGYLLGFATIIYMALPLILSALFDDERLYLFSPLGAVAILDKTLLWPLLIPPILANLVWVLLLGILIGKRYNDLVAIRTRMEKPQA